MGSFRAVCVDCALGPTPCRLSWAKKEPPKGGPMPDVGMVRWPSVAAWLRRGAATVPAAPLSLDLRRVGVAGPTLGRRTGAE